MKQSERLSFVAIAVCFSSTIHVANGFLSAENAPTRRLSTARYALAPPLIISPIIKKMKEDQEKKRQPMADPTEAANEAPGLRVGKKSWRWPAVWPYDSAFFLPNKLVDSIERKKTMDTMTSALSGVAQPMVADPEEKTAEEMDFDPIEFWTKDGAVETQLDPEAAEKLRAHFQFYLRDDMSILELGAAEDSYLPFKPKRHVGVGLSADLMGKNPSLSETMVVDLNKVEKDRDVDNDEFRLLSKEPFDAVICTNTISYLTSPREVLRSAWYLLKPGGIMLVAFSAKGACKAEFTEIQTRLWSKYNDDQHMWMTGSFFQFSAGDGWEDLLGFDISPESAKDGLKTGAMALLDKGKSNNMYVVQAYKGYQDDKVNPEDPERSIRSLCWMLPTLEGRDKSLVVPRLARVYETASTEAVRRAIEKNIPLLPKIYEVMIKMDAFAFTFSMQAQLATDLLCDPRFTASDVQIQNLKEGLGLRTPGPKFWGPVGKDTARVPVEDKISLLGYIVPCFDSKDPALEAALESFVTGLKPAYAVIRSKCPGMSEDDIQLLGSELLAYELLTPGATNREEFALWLGALTQTELVDLLDIRKSYRRAAAEGLEVFKQDEEARKQRLEERKAKMAEQKETARLTRTMLFNPRTENFEKFDNPNLKNPKK